MKVINRIKRLSYGLWWRFIGFPRITRLTRDITNFTIALIMFPIFTDDEEDDEEER